MRRSRHRTGTDSRVRYPCVILSIDQMCTILKVAERHRDQRNVMSVSAANKFDRARFTKEDPSSSFHKSRVATHNSCQTIHIHRQCNSTTRRVNVSVFLLVVGWYYLKSCTINQQRPLSDNSAKYSIRNRVHCQYQITFLRHSFANAILVLFLGRCKMIQSDVSG